MENIYPEMPYVPLDQISLVSFFKIYGKMEKHSQCLDRDQDGILMKFYCLWRGFSQERGLYFFLMTVNFCRNHFFHRIFFFLKIIQVYSQVLKNYSFQGVNFNEKWSDHSSYKNGRMSHMGRRKKF